MFGGRGRFDLSVWLDFVIADVGWPALAGDGVCCLSAIRANRKQVRFTANAPCNMSMRLENDGGACTYFYIQIKIQGQGELQSSIWKPLCPVFPGP